LETIKEKEVVYIHTEIKGKMYRREVLQKIKRKIVGRIGIEPIIEVEQAKVGI
jgi:hypothetical protein